MALKESLIEVEEYSHSVQWLGELPHSKNCVTFPFSPCAFLQSKDMLLNLTGYSKKTQSCEYECGRLFLSVLVL